MKLGLIINTFNQPDYLARVFRAVTRQSILPDEVLVADDGSGEQTRKIVESAKSTFPGRTIHIWQEKNGFRRSLILNKAIAQSRSDYLVFLDGDSLPHPEFISDHHKTARAGCVVQGHRALIEEKGAVEFGLGDFGHDRWKSLRTGQLRGWKHAFRWPMPSRRVRDDLKGIRGCNLAIWRNDLIVVNGYNEAFVGWGREDSELIVRLKNAGVQRLDIRGWCLVYHLWHPPADRSGLASNDHLLAESLATNPARCAKGLSGHLIETQT